MYEINEEEATDIALKEEYTLPKTPQLASLAAWVHHTPNILKANRISHMTPVPPEESEITEEEMMAAILDQDPLVPRLRPLGEDAPLPEFSTAWVHKTAGD